MKRRERKNSHKIVKNRTRLCASHTPKQYQNSLDPQLSDDFMYFVCDAYKKHTHTSDRLETE